MLDILPSLQKGRGQNTADHSSDAKNHKNNNNFYYS